MREDSGADVRVMDYIARQKHVIELMVRMYCRDNHRSESDLCDECGLLLEYACIRLDNCRFGNNKPSCRKCPVHCYSRSRRDEIRKVMKYAGPRMIVYHPVEAVRHWFAELSWGLSRRLRLKK